jgi:hypothetical protein
MALVAPDPNVVLIGTGVDWKVVSFDEIKALSAVLDNREGKWLLCQFQLSEPAGGQAEGLSWPTHQG